MSFSFCWDCARDESLIKFAGAPVLTADVAAHVDDELADAAAHIDANAAGMQLVPYVTPPPVMDANLGASITVGNLTARQSVPIRMGPVREEVSFGAWINPIIPTGVDGAAAIPMNNTANNENDWDVDGFVGDIFAREGEPEAAEIHCPIVDYAEPDEVKQEEEVKEEIDGFVGDFFEGIFAHEGEPETVEIHCPIVDCAEPDEVKQEDEVKQKDDDISFGSSILDDDGEKIYVRVVTLMPGVINISSGSEENEV